MTTTSQRAATGGPHDIRAALGWTALTLVGACALAYVALANVSGATTRGSGSCCDVEFVNASWWNAAFVLAVPIFLATRASYWFAPAAVLIATVAQLYVADTVVERYAESGWGDGLESLSYFWAVVMGLLFTLAAVAGAVASFLRRRREERPRNADTVTE